MGTTLLRFRLVLRALFLRGGLAGLGLALVMAPSAEAAKDPPQSLDLQTPKDQVEAPAFTLADLDGKKVPLRSFRGKIVLMNFFATWCMPCREEMPGMERLYQTYKDQGLVVLAIDMHEGAKTVRAFMRKLQLSFPALLDKDGGVAYMYGIRPIPASYLVSRDGRIVWRAFGAREWDSAEARTYFARLLAGPNR